MISSRVSFPSIHVLLTSMVVMLATGCAPESTAPLVAAVELSSAKGGGGSSSEITISSVSPDTGSLGTTLDVRVLGSGFDDGSVAEFALDGVKDPDQIRTNSTRYVNSKELVANISISNTATTTTWDVIVTNKGKTGIGTESDIFTVVDPAATWVFPANDASLSIQSDGLYSDGTQSTYADRVCRVEAKIYATTQASNSGDATIKTSAPKGKTCGRRFTFIYPDGFSETLPTFANLVELQNTTFSIAVGASVNRKLNFNPAAATNVSTRCGRLLYGAGAVGAGSDSVRVTRLDSSTWRVESQGEHRAYCENNGQLYGMPVRFTVISSTPLP
jgi:hypothetical protein